MVLKFVYEITMLFVNYDNLITYTVFNKNISSNLFCSY